MKRAIPRSVLEQMNAAKDTREEGGDTPSPGGVGGAWKAGVVAQVESDLGHLREDIAKAVLSGKREISLDPAQIDDPIGTDRRTGWIETESFDQLTESIERNGQDVPVQVWPADPNWRPDPRAPVDASGVRFHLLSGRRRHAACARLGRPVRAVIKPSPEGTSEEGQRFEMLFHRFRENDAREDLSPFERLVSIGEIYEALAAAEEGAPTAVAFAKRIGVHESIVSRARAVWRHRETLLNTFKTPWDMSFKALQGALADIETRNPKSKAKPKLARKPKVLRAKLERGGRKLSATLDSGKLTIEVPGVDIDVAALEKVLGTLGKALPKKSAKGGKS